MTDKEYSLDEMLEILDRSTLVLKAKFIASLNESTNLTARFRVSHSLSAGWKLCFKLSKIFRNFLE